MVKVLVVDDSNVDRVRAGRLIEKGTGLPSAAAPDGLAVVYATNGREALDVLEREHPDVVVTDLQMPEMDGLELVLQVRIRYPLVPVILMTAHGSEDLAARALLGGAASYVPKRDMIRDLPETVEAVIEAAQAKRGHKRLCECLTRTESEFVLDNDPSLIAPLVGALKDSLFRMSGSDETGLIQTTIALREALVNAMEHGNLELDSALRYQDEAAYRAMAEARRKQKPYSERRVKVTARETPTEAVWIIRDEGPGFDISQLPNPTDASNLDHSERRGLRLMQTFMDEVRFNARGNEVTLVRRAKRTVAD
jgi:CheY-like chemotaxis protein/anti-sigma regulatory factor (Ser/Thr protein kinase)